MANTHRATPTVPDLTDEACAMLSPSRSVPDLPLELQEDALFLLVAHLLQLLDARNNGLPTFVPPKLGHALLCVLPHPPPRISNLIFVRLRHCQASAFAARGNVNWIRRVAHERELAASKYRHIHRSPWSSTEPLPMDWIQSVAAGASRGNQTHVLEWLKHEPEATPTRWQTLCASTAAVNIPSNPLIVASACGSLNALAWWKQELGRLLCLSDDRSSVLAVECMALAAVRGHHEVVQWWLSQFEATDWPYRDTSASLDRMAWVWERFQLHANRLGMDPAHVNRALALAQGLIHY